MSLKTFIQRMLNKVGYGIHRAKACEYTVCLTYSPWVEDWFQEIYRKVSAYTLVSGDRCYMIYKLCSHCLNHWGDFAECGVYKGGTSFLIASAMEGSTMKTKRELLVFDSFAGMPSSAEHDPSAHKQGDFGDVSLKAVRKYLGDFPFVVFHPGFIPETFESVKERHFSFVHIDVDLYQSVKDCCCFFYSRMLNGGIMLFDDYGFTGYKFSAKKAIDDFFCDKLEKPIALRTGQSLVIKV